MEWFSWVIAIGLGLSAVISPIFTAIINNRYQLSLKKLEMYEIAKREALENFIKCASKCFNGKNNAEAYAYYDSVNNLYIYFSNVPKNINNLEHLLGNNFTNELSNIVQDLSKQIKKE